MYSELGVVKDLTPGIGRTDMLHRITEGSS